MFSSPDLPAALSLDLSNGMIRGRIFDARRYEFSVTISNAAGQSQTVPVTILVE
ncbi:Ig domain-containing protein [Agrobacterium tumefaciens]